MYFTDTPINFFIHFNLINAIWNVDITEYQFNIIIGNNLFNKMQLQKKELWLLGPNLTDVL